MIKYMKESGLQIVLIPSVIERLRCFNHRIELQKLNGEVVSETSLEGLKATRQLDR